jgi:hypothetical protein
MTPQREDTRNQSARGTRRGRGRGGQQNPGRGRGSEPGRREKGGGRKNKGDQLEFGETISVHEVRSINPQLLHTDSSMILSEFQNNFFEESQRQQSESTAPITFDSVALRQREQFSQIPLQRSGNVSNPQERLSAMSGQAVVPPVVPTVSAQFPAPIVVPRRAYSTVKRRRIERQQEVGHVRLDQTLLQKVSEAGSKLSIAQQEKIAACLLSDKFAVPMVVAEFKTPETFVQKKLVSKAVYALTRKKTIERINSRRAAQGASARDRASEEDNGEARENVGAVSRVSSRQLVDSSEWSESTANNLLLLKNDEFLKNIEDVVTVSVVADVSVAGFLSRIQKVISTDSLEISGGLISQMRSTTAIAEIQEKVKKLIAVSVAVSEMEQGKKQGELILHSLKKTRKKRSVATLQENLSLLVTRFSTRILFCLPFIDGFELENLATLSANSLDQLTQSPSFYGVAPKLLACFTEEGALLDELLE